MGEGAGAGFEAVLDVIAVGVEEMGGFRGDSGAGRFVETMAPRTASAASKVAAMM